MEKFIKYLEKQGVQRVSRTNNFESLTYDIQICGDYSYFEEAPNFTYKRVCIALEYNVLGDREYFHNIAELEKKIELYCKKYGYILTSYVASYARYLYIEKAEDKEKADNYYYFRDACLKQWEEVYHIMYTAGRKENGEKAAKILNRIYSLRYRQFLRATEA